MAAAKNVIELQRIKFDLFKSQDPEIGRFDVTFELGEKLLYAHKNILNLVSDTFDLMLSERWTSKNEPIKIEGYTFDEFYQFITFLYSGECELTNDNIYSMVDIAEFYQINCFKNYCDEFLSKTKITEENAIQILELTEKYSLIQSKPALQTYISTNIEKFINSEIMLTLKKSIIQYFVVICKDKTRPEHLFKLVYKWAEKQAMDKCENSNKNDAIKSEIADFLPFIDFKGMKLTFLHEFVVARGFIFSSFSELSEILCNQNEETFGFKVKITNSNGQTLSGNVIPNKSVMNSIKSLKLLINNSSNSNYCSWTPKFQIPKELSSIKAKKETQWYLFYFSAGQIGVVHRSCLHSSYYLLAELKAENDFVMTNYCKIEVDSGVISKTQTNKPQNWLLVCCGFLICWVCVLLISRQ